MVELSCWSQSVELKTISLNISLYILIVRSSGTGSLCAMEKLKRHSDGCIVPRWHRGDGCIVAVPLRAAHMYSARDVRWLRCHLLCDCISSFWKFWVLRWFFSISRLTLQCYAEDPWWSIYQMLITSYIWWGAWLLVIWWLWDEQCITKETNN